MSKQNPFKLGAAEKAIIAIIRHAETSETISGISRAGGITRNLMTSVVHYLRIQHHGFGICCLTKQLHPAAEFMYCQRNTVTGSVEYYRKYYSDADQPNRTGRDHHADTTLLQPYIIIAEGLRIPGEQGDMRLIYGGIAVDPRNRFHQHCNTSKTRIGGVTASAIKAAHLLGHPVRMFPVGGRVLAAEANRVETDLIRSLLGRDGELCVNVQGLCPHGKSQVFERLRRWRDGQPEAMRAVINRTHLRVQLERLAAAADDRQSEYWLPRDELVRLGIDALIRAGKIGESPLGKAESFAAPLTAADIAESGDA